MGSRHTPFRQVGHDVGSPGMIICLPLAPCRTHAKTTRLHALDGILAHPTPLRRSGQGEALPAAIAAALRMELAADIDDPLIETHEYGETHARRDARDLALITRYTIDGLARAREHGSVVGRARFLERSPRARVE